jgi:hypothetical protein
MKMGHQSLMKRVVTHGPLHGASTVGVLEIGIPRHIEQKKRAHLDYYDFHEIQGKTQGL